MVARTHSRHPLFLAALLLLNACGGRSVNQKTARDLIVALPGGILDSEDVSIDSVSTTGAKDAIVETRVRTAFKLEKREGRWEVREVRFGNHQWEKVEDVLRAMEELKAGATKQAMALVMDSVAKYRERTGSLPEFRDFVSLTDRLAPEFLNPLVRLDAWRNPLAAFRTGEHSVKLVSAGPDGREGTADDIEETRDFNSGVTATRP